jgi:hypothetical protein
MLPAPPRRKPNDSLLKLLVAPPHPLAQPRPQALHVAPQQPLPPNMRFGPTQPGITTNTPFSGGVSANPLNVAHPPAPRLGFAQADFVAPRYQQAQMPARAAPLLTTLFPLVASVLAGGAGGGGALGGATATPPPPPRTIPAPSSWTTPGYQTNLPATPSLGPPGPTLTANPQAGQAALLAALAGQGLRFNPSAGGSSYVKAY